MSDLTSERLAELRRIAEAATPGLWEVVGLDGYGGPYALRMPHRSGRTWYGVEGIKRREDAEYIAIFDPPTVLALLDEIERLMERQRKVRHALRAAVNHIGEPQHPYERAGISQVQLALQVLDGRYDREGHGRR